MQLKQMGAQGDGLKDNSAIFQRALDMGVRKLILEAGKYYISKPLVINGPDVEIMGQGADVTTLFGNGNLLVDVRTRAVASWQYDGNIHSGTHRLAFPKQFDLKKGMLLHVASPQGMPETTSGGYTSHYTGLISEVHGADLVLDHDIEIPFNQDITITAYHPNGFTLSNITLQTDNTPYIVQVRGRGGVRFENVIFKTPGEKYMGEYRASNPELGVTAIAAYGCVDVEADSCKFEHIWYGLMAHEGCYDVRLLNSSALESRHINNNGIGTDHFHVENCLAERCEGGFDSHPTALGSTFVNCRDLQARGMSKFRGRRDSVVNCIFEHGMELSTDDGILDLATDTVAVFKTMTNTQVSGDKLSVRAANVTISGCVINAPVMPTKLSGRFVMDEVTIDVRLDTSECTGLTIGDFPAVQSTYIFSLKNVTLLGPWKPGDALSTIGIYIPMRAGVSGEFENIEISGFEKGLVLYGGEESKERYHGIGMTQVVIHNCDYGIFQQDFFDKTLRVDDIRVSDCRVRDNAPGRIKQDQTDH